MAPPTADSGGDNLPLEQLVFSCAICQATPAEVYATTESNQGFHNAPGYDDKERSVIKMWIAECSHITCAKHLENGAPPFHPEGQPPRAACPKCSRDRSDDKPKALYSIRGLGDGEYDPMIPSEWRKCPAVKLDSSVPQMSALRFQYMALAHFARQARKHWKSAEATRLASDGTCSEERKKSSQLRKEVRELKERVKDLEKAEVTCKKWEARKPEISHYLGVVGEMARDIESMRSELRLLGVEVPASNYAFKGQGSTDHEQDTGKDFESTSSRKRKLDEYASRDPDLANIQPTRRSSREIMPPPPPRSSPSKGLRPDSVLQNIHANGRQAYSDPLVQQHERHLQHDQDVNYAEQYQDMPNGAGMQDDPRLQGYEPPSHFSMRDHRLPAQHLDQAKYSNPAQTHPSLYGHQQLYERSPHQVPPLGQHITARQYHRSHGAAASSTSMAQTPYEPPAISPFFRNDNSHAQRPETQRLPTRGSFIQQHYLQTPADRGSTAYGTNVLGMEPVPHFPDHRTPGRLSYIEQQRRPTSQRPAYQPHLQLSQRDSYFQRAPTLPQTPRNSQGFLQRPDLFPPRSTYSSSRALPQDLYGSNPASRIQNFALSNEIHHPARPSSHYEPRFMTQRHCQDEELSRLPGVKGLRGQPSFTAASQLGSSYGGARGLGSSVGRGRGFGR